MPPCTGTGADFKTALANYIRGPFPVCPVGPAASQNDNVVPVTGATTAGVASPTDGWKFNTTNGTFIINNSNASVSDNTVNYDKF